MGLRGGLVNVYVPGSRGTPTRGTRRCRRWGAVVREMAPSPMDGGEEVRPESVGSPEQGVWGCPGVGHILTGLNGRDLNEVGGGI